MARDRPRRQYHLRFGGVIYLVTALLVGIAALNSQTNLLFGAFGLMMGAIIVSGMVNGAMLSGVRIERLAPGHGSVDEPLALRYEVSNRSRLVACFGLIVSERDGAEGGALVAAPVTFVMHIGPRRSTVVEAAARPRRRGPLRLDRLRVATTFPLGLLRKSVTVSRPRRIVIHPRTWPLRRELLAAAVSMDPSGQRAARQPGGSEEFFGLREYREGDGIRRIDWKHTARMDTLVSREMTRLRPPQLMVVLDLRPGRGASAGEAERAISFAASVIREAPAAGIEIGLSVHGVACPAFEPRADRRHADRLMRALGELDLSPDQGRGQASATADPPPAGPITWRRRMSWLVIHAGRIDGGFGPADALRLSDADADRWRLDRRPPAGGKGPASSLEKVEAA